MSKITDLPSGTPEDADLLEFVDVSDTTLAPTGTNKSVLWSAIKTALSALYAPISHTHVEADITDLDVGVETVVGGTDITVDATDPANPIVNYTGTGGGGAAATSQYSKVLIEEIDLATAGQFDFDNIPAGYDRLIIQGKFGSSSGNSADQIRGFFNGDFTDANYSHQLNSAVNGGPSNASGATPYVGAMGGTSSAAPQATSFEMIIESYDDSDTEQSSLSYYGAVSTASTHYMGQSHVIHDSATDPITRVTIRPDGYPTDGCVGTLRLYGEKSITIEDSETITTKKHVATITNPVSGAFDFDLTNFQDGDRIVIEGHLASAVASTSDVVSAWLNGDTTPSNYRYRYTNRSTSTNATGTADGNRVAICPGTTGVANYSPVRIEVQEYTTNILKVVNGRGMFQMTTSDVKDVDAIATHDTMTAPITQVTVTTDGGEDLSGTLTCYIEKQGVLPAVPKAGGLIEIETITDPNGDFDFTGIAGTYKRLVLKGEIRSNDAAGYGLGTIYLNGDTTAQDSNYRSTHSLVQDTTVLQLNDNFPHFNQTTGSLAGATDYATVEFSIENYAASGKSKIIVFNTYGAAAPTSNIRNFGSIQSSTDAPVTGVRVTAQSGGWNGYITLYGEN